MKLCNSGAAGAQGRLLCHQTSYVVNVSMTFTVSEPPLVLGASFLNSNSSLEEERGCCLLAEEAI